MEFIKNRRNTKLAIIITMVIYFIYWLFVKTDYYSIHKNGTSEICVVTNPPENNFEFFALILDDFARFEKRGEQMGISGIGFIKENIAYNRFYNHSVNQLILGNRYNMKSTDCCEGIESLGVTISFEEDSIWLVSKTHLTIIYKNETAVYFPFGWQKDRSQHWRPYIFQNGNFVESDVSEWRPKFLSNLDSTKYKHIHWR